MSREATELEPFRQGEVDDITFPCGPLLKAGETVTGAVIVCVRDHGEADLTPSARIAVSRQISGSDVIQRFTATVGGVWYRLYGDIDLSSGRKLVGECLFFVQPRP